MSILKVGMYASSRVGSIPNENFLTFSSSNPFLISFTAKHWDGVLEYSVDTQNWYEWDASVISSVGNFLYLRGLGNSVITGAVISTYAMTISSSSGVSCTGNIMALLDHVSPETAVMGVACFANMFRDEIRLVTAPELPATTLAKDCYHNMFRGTRLVTPPELPATQLAEGCYRAMFYSCPNLSVAPELPATTLATNCYRQMFYNSTRIEISSSQTGIYQKPWRIPTVGTIGSSPSGWNSSMLSGTGGTFISNPSANTTYYQAG